MAQLVVTPKKIAADFTQKDGENFSDFMKRSDVAFERLCAEAAALPDGEVVGAIIHLPYADGYAHYRVSSASPLKLQHINVGDGWHVGAVTIRGLRLDDVTELVNRARHQPPLLAEQDNRASGCPAPLVTQMRNVLYPTHDANR